MTSTLTAALSLVVNTIRSLIDFAFSTDHPGFVGISIGAVAVGIFMIALGFDYFEFFLGGGKEHIREDKK